MSDTVVKFYRKTKDVPLPKRMSDLASGFDLVALMDKPLILEPGVPVLIPTGIHVAVPAGWEAQVRPRSSLSAKGIIVSFGTVDADYRGELFAAAINASRVPYEVLPGDRVAQLVFSAVLFASCQEVEVLDALGSTSRGTGGFGSTGR